MKPCKRVLAVATINAPSFSTRWRDPTGLYYFGGRYYDAAVGRFLSPDPARFFDSRNLYAYCANDPVNSFDPDGMLQAQLHNEFQPAVGASSYSKPFQYAAQSWSYAPEGRSYGAFSQASSLLYQGQAGRALGSFLHELVGRVTGFDSLNSATSGYDTYTGTKLTGGQRLGQGALGAMTFASLAVPVLGVESRAGAGAIGLEARAMAAEARAVGTEARAATAFAKNAPVIIGENMNRVNAYAGRVGGETIDGWLAGRKWTQQLNDEFIATMKAQGRQFQDIGPAFRRRRLNRVDPSLGRPPSSVYGGERQSLLDYGNYQRLYDRTGKYQGGVPGLDP